MPTDIELKPPPNADGVEVLWKPPPIGALPNELKPDCATPPAWGDAAAAPNAPPACGDAAAAPNAKPVAGFENMEFPPRVLGAPKAAVGGAMDNPEPIDIPPNPAVGCMEAGCIL